MEAAPLYRAAAQQYRKLKNLLNRLDKLSKTILRYHAKLAAPRVAAAPPWRMRQRVAWRHVIAGPGG
jgi:hypothetical protein